MHQAPAPDQEERFYGVLLAEVTSNTETQALPPAAHTGRIQVRFPGLTGDSITRWARCARPMAGSGAGFFALPQPGEQVLVAFEHGRLTEPYVLGALWNAQSRPPATNADGTNATTVLRSRTGHALTFDDGPQGLLSLNAAGDLQITASGSITIGTGQTSITLTEQGVDVQ
nr:phage baseplate assembly protein V [Kineosporia babensis]